MLKIKNLSKSYGEKVLFQDFSLNLDKGEKVVLRAPSGRGKTTLFRSIMGIVKPDKGEIWVDGIHLSPKTVYDVRKKISYAGELPATDIPAQEYVHEILNYAANAKKENTVFYEWAEKLKLELSNKTLGSLSAGERCRLSLALACTLNNPLYLLDEPLANLDSVSRETVISMIDQLSATVLIISHEEGFNYREVTFV